MMTHILLYSLAAHCGYLWLQTLHQPVHTYSLPQLTHTFMTSHTANGSKVRFRGFCSPSRVLINHAEHIFIYQECSISKIWLKEEVFKSNVTPPPPLINLDYRLWWQMANIWLAVVYLGEPEWAPHRSVSNICCTYGQLVFSIVTINNERFPVVEIENTDWQNSLNRLGTSIMKNISLRSLQRGWRPLLHQKWEATYRRPNLQGVYLLLWNIEIAFSCVSVLLSTWCARSESST